MSELLALIETVARANTRTSLNKIRSQVDQANHPAVYAVFSAVERELYYRERAQTANDKLANSMCAQ